MVSKDETKKLYEGKFFYEIIKDLDQDRIIPQGPFDNIYYTVPKEDNEYSFVQVIDGTIRVAFKKEEILVTDRRL